MEMNGISFISFMIDIARRKESNNQLPSKVSMGSKTRRKESYYMNFPFTCYSYITYFERIP